MLTRSGWAVAISSGGLVLAGRLFGIFELFLAGAGGAALLLGATVAVRNAKLRLEVSRELHPGRVHAGSPSRVELRVRNRGNRRTPLLALKDPVGKSRSARVVLAPLGVAEAVRASYRLPTEERGILRVGPLEVEVSDPFGLVALRTDGAPQTELTVWPAVDEVSPVPHTQGDDPHGGADHPSPLAANGDDFYALRPYVVGDDLRRVHWRSTARRDQLMVRQDEMPWQGRATVLLDTRRVAHSGATFERAVSAAASIIVATARHHFLLRLVTTAGHDTGFAAGSSHVEGILEHLAAVRVVEAGRLPTLVAALHRPGNGGALAALVGGRTGTELDSLGVLRTSFGRMVTLAFADGHADRARLGTIPELVVVDDRTSFPEAWDLALRSRSRLVRS